ncbi:MAG TPA: PQQ-binding-like beta-propeller repeat protein [Nitrososphaerales archaeon]|nr:PQQ-binding-like beta-propeller repeat protein [Nitrososphaerales archaeon]
MRRIASALLIVLLFASAAQTHSALAASQTINWAYPGYDLQNTNHLNQDTVTSQSVRNLQISWIYQVPVNPFNIPGVAPSLGIETSPLVVNGIVYVATPYNKVIALNSATGGVVWSYQVNVTEFVRDPLWARAYVISSLAFYNGSIYMMASDTSVYSLNAYTGQVEFVLPPIDKDVPGNTGQYYGEKAPLIYRNVMIVRPSTTDYGGRGFVAAYDLQTRALLWRWFSVPPAGGDPNWDAQAAKGNIQAYQGDWGNNNLVGGGAAWGLMTVDNQTGILYFSTGHPSGSYDASLRPGPNLYADSVIALNSTSGQLIWYYQINPHELTEHEGGWSLTLASITFNGQNKKVIIQAAKNNFVYVLDAASGKPLYPAIHVGSPTINSPNDNGGAGANLTASQAEIAGKEICPGPDGGVEMSPALDGNKLYVATQNACGIMYHAPVTYKGQTMDGYNFIGYPSASQNSTLYALDMSTGVVVWKFDMSNRYQGSAAVASGGVVYVVDRGGILYALDELTGNLLRNINLGGLGAAGVSFGTDLAGNVKLYAPAGGGDVGSPTTGVVVGLAVIPGAATSLIEELPVVGLGVVVILLTAYILWQKSRKRTKPVPG